ncbi:hypothetical protein C7271_01210 [filamentous cyanobacterium CCP5]|nr:hypothetical protein C7271_01210 [filamentous cyanobacterium CCP5]
MAELQSGRLSAEAFAEELEAEFASRRLNTPAQQKNYRSNVVQALKIFAPTHRALAKPLRRSIALISLSTEPLKPSQLNSLDSLALNLDKLSV